MGWMPALVVAMGLFVAGCATAPDLSMNTRLRQAIRHVDAALLVPQSELEVTVVAIDSGNTGLLGSLLASAIDARRQSDAQKIATPIVEALKRYDFRAVMARAIADEQARRPVLPIRTPWWLETVDSESHRRGLYAAAKDGAVLFVAVRYRLEAGNLHVDADARMFPKSAALASFRPAPNDSNPLDEGNAIYRKSFVVIRQNLSPYNVAAVLSDAAASIAEQLLADLGRDG